MRILRILGGSINELFTLGGLGMAFYGLHLWWPPLAWMIGGAALLWLGLTRAAAADRSDQS